MDPYIHIKGCAYKMALLDDAHLVYGTYAGGLHCLSLATDEVIWERSFEAFPFDVAAHAGRAYAACADGRLIAFDRDGTQLWVYQATMPLYNVKIARFSSEFTAVVCGGVDRQVTVLRQDGAVICRYTVEKIVHRLAVGDLNGDGLDEIFAIDGREYGIALRYDEGALEPLWHKRIQVPESMINWENPRGSFFGFSVDIADINADGQNEIVMGDTFFNKQAVLALSAQGDPLWITPAQKWSSHEQRWYEFYATAFVRCANILPERPGLETVVVFGGQVQLIGSDGTFLSQAHSLLGFTDLLIHKDTLYLGSTPNGDDTLYRIGLKGDWMGQIEALERQGRFREVHENIMAITQQIDRYNGSAVEGLVFPSIQLLRALGSDKANVGMVRERIARLRKLFPYDAIMPMDSVTMIENDPPLAPDGTVWNPGRWRVDAIRGTSSVDALVARAKRIEERGVPMLFSIGHSCMPFITLETAEKLLKAAPNCLYGFESAEDEEPALIERYMTHFIGPLADLCLKYGGKKVVIRNKGLWWMSIPAMRGVYDAMAKGERHRVLVANTEDSNSRTPELNLMGRAGVWQAGLVDTFCASVHGDLFSYCRFHQWEYPRTGSPYLRLLLAHIATGAGMNRLSIQHSITGSDSISFTELGKESVALITHLIGKGLLFPPGRAQVAGFSSVGIAMHTPDPRWLYDGHNGHVPQSWSGDPELDQAIFPHCGCEWGNTPTPTYALQYQVFNKRRQAAAFMPPTPYGLCYIVPAHACLDRIPGVTHWLHTDGIYLWEEGGERLTGMEAAQLAKKRFVEAAKDLPMRNIGDDAFVQILRMPGGGYRLYAVDPGWIAPEARHVRLLNQTGRPLRLTNVLTGEAIAWQDGAWVFTIPAGAFVIADAVEYAAN